MTDVDAAPYVRAQVESLRVIEMDDGGMGSLYLVHPVKQRDVRRLGKRVAEHCFSDADGVDVLVSLNVDTDGDLFELDIWKANFSRLLDLSLAL